MQKTENFKILIDENLSKKLLLNLMMFPESKHITTCGLEHTNDNIIWDYAKTEGFAILTRDIDFYSLSTFYGCPPKVIHLTTSSNGESTAFYRERLIRNSSSIISFLQTKGLCYLEIE